MNEYYEHKWMRQHVTSSHRDTRVTIVAVVFCLQNDAIRLGVSKDREAHPRSVVQKPDKLCGTAKAMLRKQALSLLTSTTATVAFAHQLPQIQQQTHRRVDRTPQMQGYWTWLGGLS